MKGKGNLSNPNARTSSIRLRLLKLLQELQNSALSIALILLLFIILRKPARPPRLPNHALLFEANAGALPG
jgi:hypothetical protein